MAKLRIESKVMIPNGVYLAKIKSFFPSDNEKQLIFFIDVTVNGYTQEVPICINVDLNRPSELCNYSFLSKFTNKSDEVEIDENIIGEIILISISRDKGWLGKWKYHFNYICEPQSEWIQPYKDYLAQKQK